MFPSASRQGEETSTRDLLKHFSRGPRHRGSNLQINNDAIIFNDARNTRLMQSKTDLPTRVLYQDNCIYVFGIKCTTATYI
jgi:hypothetical protein